MAGSHGPILSSMKTRHSGTSQHQRAAAAGAHMRPCAPLSPQNIILCFSHLPDVPGVLMDSGPWKNHLGIFPLLEKDMCHLPVNVSPGLAQA